MEGGDQNLSVVVCVGEEVGVYVRCVRENKHTVKMHGVCEDGQHVRNRCMYIYYIAWCVHFSPSGCYVAPFFEGISIRYTIALLAVMSHLQGFIIDIYIYMYPNMGIFTRIVTPLGGVLKRAVTPLWGFRGNNE